MLDQDQRIISASLGDPARFGDLVPRHGPALHAYLARRVQRDVADDLLADTWFAALKSRRQYDSRRGGVRGWLFGIARHVLFAQLRQDSRTAGSVSLLLEQAGARHTEDGWSDIDSRLDAQSARVHLLAGLAALSPDDREILLLVSWEQMSPTEAAEVQGVPAGTARSRLHRARRTMRTHLSGTQVTSFLPNP